MCVTHRHSLTTSQPIFSFVTLHRELSLSSLKRVSHSHIDSYGRPYPLHMGMSGQTESLSTKRTNKRFNVFANTRRCKCEIGVRARPANVCVLWMSLPSFLTAGKLKIQWETLCRDEQLTYISGHLHRRDPPSAQCSVFTGLERPAQYLCRVCFRAKMGCEKK